MGKTFFEKLGYWRRYFKRNTFVFGKGFTPARFINFLTIEYELRRSAIKVSGRPWSLFIDPINTCVLHCPLCGTGQGFKAREHRVLPYETFVKYLEPLAPYLYYVKLYNYGEPFLNPRLHDMVRFCSERKIITQVNSNLNVLTREQAEAVILAGLDRLVVSFDGITQEAYTSYRRGGDLAKVKEHLALFSETKKRLNCSNPKIVLQYLLTKHNEQEYGRIKAYAESIGAEFFPQPITLDPANKEQIEAWLPKNEAYTHYDRAKGIKKKEQPDRFCGFLWNDPVINVDGGLSPCCHLFYESTDFGSLEKESFGKIWNNEKFIAARRIFKDKNIAQKELVCSRCVDVRAFEDMNFDLINENRTNNLR